MRKAFFITGTDTDIGKSVVTAGLALYFQDQGWKTGVFKPLQSGAQRWQGRYYSEDAYLSAKLLGCVGKTDEFGPFCLPGEKAPYYAMLDSGNMITLAQLEEKYQKLQEEYDVLLVEGAGGACVPYLSEDFLAADLAVEWDLPAIIVARGGLGTINHLLLTIEYLKGKNVEIAGFILNKVGEKEYPEAKSNAAAIKRMSGTACLGIIPDLQGDYKKRDVLLHTVKDNCQELNRLF